MATQEDVDAFLVHHGIKGMRWGVRNAESKDEEGSSPKNNHVGLKTAGAGVGTALLTYKVTGRAGLSVAAGAGTAWAVHNNLTKVSELHHHAPKGESFVKNYVSKS
jgi:hypothetical protein